MRPFRWVVSLSLMLGAPACSPSPAVPVAHVSDRHALRVSFVAERDMVIDFGGQQFTRAEVSRAFDGAEDAIVRFNRAVDDTLRRAGYEVTGDGPHDVRVVQQLYFRIESRQSRHGRVGDSDLVRVVFHVVSPDGAELDRFELRTTDETSPLGPPERVVADLVNAMTESPKLGTYAEARPRDIAR